MCDRVAVEGKPWHTLLIDAVVTVAYCYTVVVFSHVTSNGTDFAGRGPLGWNISSLSDLVCMSCKSFMLLP